MFNYIKGLFCPLDNHKPILLMHRSDSKRFYRCSECDYHWDTTLIAIKKGAQVTRVPLSSKKNAIGYSSNKTISKKSPLAIKRDAWFASKEGLTCSNYLTLTTEDYLKNRLESAFLAGAVATEETRKLIEEEDLNAS